MGLVGPRRYKVRPGPVAGRKFYLELYSEGQNRDGQRRVCRGWQHPGDGTGERRHDASRSDSATSRQFLVCPAGRPARRPGPEVYEDSLTPLERNSMYALPIDRIWLAGGCLALLLAAGTGCGSPAPASSALPTPKVTVVAAVSSQTIDADEYIGRTEASEIVEVRSRVFGFLKTIEFNDGDYVTEGKVLFTIEPDEYKAI